MAITIPNPWVNTGSQYFDFATKSTKSFAGAKVVQQCFTGVSGSACDSLEYTKLQQSIAIYTKIDCVPRLIASGSMSFNVVTDGSIAGGPPPLIVVASDLDLLVAELLLDIKTKL